MTKGRPLKNVSMNGREFRTPGDAAGTRSLGGMTNEVKLNGDNETARVTQTPTAWAITGQPVQVDDDLGEQEFVQGLVDSGITVDFVFDFGNGYRYQAKGTIVEALELDMMERLMTLNFSGPGKMKKI